MPKLDDLTGRRFGSWTVLSRSFNRDKITKWLCRCDCGTERAVYSINLKRGLSRSCGCATGPLWERFGNRKLTDDQVRSIRKDPRRQTHIAREYGVAQSAISFIKSRRNWRSLPDESPMDERL